MKRKWLQTEIQQQQEHLNRIRQSFHIDQEHPMFTRAGDIQKVIDEIKNDLNQFPDAASYESINAAIVEYIKSQIDQLKNEMIVRN